MRLRIYHGSNVLFQKSPVKSRVVEKKTGIFNAGIRQNFVILGCDMASILKGQYGQNLFLLIY